MLSKVFNSALSGLFRVQVVTLSNTFKFCTSNLPRQEFQQLRNRIISISTLDEFNNLFVEKRQQFDASCYSIASRTLAKILIESKIILNYKNREAIKNYLSNLQKADIESLSIQQFSQLLYLLRIIKLDPNNNTTFVGQYIRTILSRSEDKLKELQQETGLSRLAYFYQEYSSLGGKQATTLARRINQVLRSNNSDVEFQQLTINQINLILKGMKSKQSIYNDQIILLKNIVRTVLQKYLDKISFFELSQISVGINEVTSLNPNAFSLVYNSTQIHKKVLANIDEMDEKSIMYILNAKKTSNRIYNQIHKLIFQKIMDEIQPNGESSFNELFTLRLLNGISDKVRLQSTTLQNQEKFFVFLRQALTKNPKFIKNFVESYVRRGFFTNKHLLRVQEILETIPDISFKLPLLYVLAKRGINLEKLFDINRLQIQEIRDRNLVMTAAVLESIVEQNGPNKEEYKEQLIKLRQRFLQNYKVEDETFSRLVNILDSQLVETLYKVFKVEIEKNYPNPLETEQPAKYRAAWLLLHVHGINQIYFLKKFAPNIKDKLTDQDFESLFKQFIIGGYFNNDSISNLLTLISKRYDLFLPSDNLINYLSRFMNTQIATIFEDGSSELIRNRYWYILNEMLEKLEPNRFFYNFASVINIILHLTSYHFRYSSQYQSMLARILQKAQFIRSKFLQSQIVDECLKLNLIKRIDIANMSQNLKDNLSKPQILMLKMIENNEFLLEGVQMTKNNLHLFFYNLSPGTLSFLNANKEKVMTIIQEMNLREIWKCLIHFRLGSKKIEASIIDALFNQLNKFNFLFQENSPIFVAEMLRRNNFDKFFVKIDGVKNFFQNSLVYFAQKRNIYKLPLEDHIQLIKSANDFRVRNDEYIHAIFERFVGDLNIFKRELYLVAGNMELALTQKQIDKLIDFNFFSGFNASFSKCFNIFLLFEKQIPNPSKHLANLIKKYNELAAKEKVPVFALHLEYLRKNYPLQTKDWNPNHIEKADFCRSLENLASKSLNSLREITEDVTKEKWVENVISNNYYYSFRNVAFIFPIQSKYYGENLVLKRILISLTGIQKIILVNRRQSNTRSAFKFIVQSYKSIFSLEEEAAITKRLDIKFDQIKHSENQEDHEDHEEPVEQQKAQDQPKQ